MSTNPLRLVMEAVSESADVIQQQQLADGDSTIMDTQMEQKIYDDQTVLVNQAETDVATAAKNLEGDPTNQKLQAALGLAQAAFQNTETLMQTYTQQADGGTQAMQNQVGQDSSNAQAKIQLEAAVNQVLQTLTAALGR